MNLIIDAIRKVGPDHEDIKDYLSTVYFEGITGNIHFDTLGNRAGLNYIIGIKEEQIVPVKSVKQ